jgi:hypothetical protein
MTLGNRWRVAAVFLVFGLGACRTAPIYNPSAVSYAPSTSATMETVAQAIQRAGSGLGWTVEAVQPGEMKGRLELRRHVAVVSIKYDMKRFSISYVSSENLAHSGNTIHRNYNNWIRNLENAIREEVSAV